MDYFENQIALHSLAFAIEFEQKLLTEDHALALVNSRRNIATAEKTISDAINSQLKSGLTYGELFSAMSQVQQRWSKYMIEDEANEWRIASEVVNEENNRLRAAMRLAESQYLGCGGNLTPEEIVSSMRRILNEALGNAE